MAPFFQLVDPASLNQDELNRFSDRTIQQTLPWIQFLTETQNAEPIFAVLKAGSRTLGYFSGLITRRFGFKILGSPFPGWSTTYMGFNLFPGASRSEALDALVDLCFHELKCDHLELMDRHISHEQCSGRRFTIWDFASIEIDLTETEDEIFHRMKHQCRNCIRKAQRSGVIIEVSDDEGFAQDYYRQIQHVFATKGLPPPFGMDRVESLIRNVYPTGKLLLLRARNRDGVCIATGIFPAMNTTAYAWGSASLRQYSGDRPNEAIFWYAMKYWKDRGMRVFDLVGAAEYKKKYGGHIIVVPWIRKSKNWITAFLRTEAEAVFLKFPRSFAKLSKLGQSSN